jgi:hypothetical protein
VSTRLQGGDFVNPDSWRGGQLLRAAHDACEGSA